MTDIMSPIEQALTHAEDVLEALDHSAIAEAIPFVERAVKVWRAGSKFRDAMLARKLLSFISDPSLQNPDTRAQMRERAKSEDGRKIGEMLFLVLERLNDLQKPEWLAKVYAAYLAGEFMATDFRRVTSAIDIAFADDLNELINSPETLLSTEPWLKNLYPSGLTELQVLSTFGNSAMRYNVSPWGMQFKQAVRNRS